MDQQWRMYHAVGWMLFLLCAVLFLFSGWRSGDAMITAGSALFLIACIVFLYSLIVKGR
jgi:uncharacterized membrane protein YhhN